jgi:hypothetical protein
MTTRSIPTDSRARGNRWVRRTLWSALVLALGCDSGSDAASADSGAKPGDRAAASKAPGDPPSRLADAKPSERDADRGDADAGDDLDGFDPRVVQAAKLARDIEKDPAAADDVLVAAGLSRDALDSLMFEIARDPDLTGQYRIARAL